MNNCCKYASLVSQIEKLEREYVCNKSSKELLINILPHIVEYDPIIDVEEFEQFTLEFSNGNERLCMGLCDILFDPIYYCIYESNITKIHGYIHIKHNDDISYIMRIIKMFHMEHN